MLRHRPSKEARRPRRRWLLVGSVAAALGLLVASCSTAGSELAVGQCGGEQPGSAISPPPADSGTLLFEEGFDSLEVGEFSATELEATWNSPPWQNGVDDGRASVVASNDGQVLRVSYPQGMIGSGGSGAQWPYLFGSEPAVHLSYRVRFGDDFEFVRGGKLPGLAGGEGNGGGDIPNGSDGWSGRVTWGAEGCGSFYLYHPDMEGPWGEYLLWPARFEPGRWHTVDQVVVINTPGKRDGAVFGWLDDRLVAERQNLRFRDVDGFAVDILYFSTFFGGGDESYAPPSDQTIEFDSFVLRSIPVDSVQR